MKICFIDRSLTLAFYRLWRLTRVLSADRRLEFAFNLLTVRFNGNLCHLWACSRQISGSVASPYEMKSPNQVQRCCFALLIQSSNCETFVVWLHLFASSYSSLLRWHRQGRPPRTLVLISSWLELMQLCFAWFCSLYKTCNTVKPALLLLLLLLLCCCCCCCYLIIIIIIIIILIQWNPAIRTPG